MIVIMLMMFGSAMPALLAFPSERPIFLREYSTNHYSVISYFISKLTMECVVTLIQSTILVRRCSLLLTYLLCCMMPDARVWSTPCY
jgi:hypothetical protein